MRLISAIKQGFQIRKYRLVAIRMARKRRYVFELAKTFHDELQLSKAKIRQLEAALNMERKISQEDALTGLLNRHGMNRRIGEMRSFVSRSLVGSQAKASLLLFDLNKVKRMNTDFGHAFTDSVLKAFGDILAQTFSREQDILCRQGGDEFVVILPHTSVSDAHQLAQEAIGRLRVLVVSQKAPAFIGLSCGVAEFSLADENGFDSAFNRADQAMYVVKETGRSGVQLAEAA